MRRLWLLVAASALVAFLFSTTAATVIHVPQQHTTIQAGIDAAVDGDTVLVADGWYGGDGNRDLDFLGKAILVTSENGPQATVINCGGSPEEPHRGFYFHTGEGPGSVLRGFGIRHGYGFGPFPQAPGGGIFCDASSPVIEGNEITENTAYVYGGGIYCRDCSPVIVGNTITMNTATCYGGGGIFCDNACPTITNNVIAWNAAAYGDGGGIYCDYSSPAVEGNMISGNTCLDDGGGIYCAHESFRTIEGNTVAGNTCLGDGGGIYCAPESFPTIEGNTVTGNTADDNGGGICADDDCSPMILDNVIAENTAVMQWGGGIYCGYGSCPIIEGNTIVENTSERGGGIIGLGASLTVVNNTIAGNAADIDAGGVYSYGGTAVVEGNTITDNTGTWGGGVCCWNPYPPGPVEIVANTIAGNTATYGGGILCVGHFFYPPATIAENTIVDNRAEEDGGGLLGWSSDLIVERNTFTDNTAAWGGGISCRQGSFLMVLNSILWGDSADVDPEIHVESGGAISVDYSDIEGGWQGTGNIDADPCWVSPTYGDYRLLWGSPCIDAGRPDSMDLDPDGTWRDMGAHFFDQGDYLTLYLTPVRREVAPGGELGVVYTAINRRTEPEPFWVLSEAILPGGDTLRVMGPDHYTLPAEHTVQQQVAHDVPAAAPCGEYRYRSMIGVPPGTLYDEDSFSFRVASTSDYLIWEPDLTPISGVPITDALSAIGRSAEFVEGPLGRYNLHDFQGIFICLGIYPNNAMILEGSPEAAQIEEYIATGGNVCMEGGDVWYEDPPAGGHNFGPSFRITSTCNCWSDLYNVDGVENTLMPGLAALSSPYFGENSWLDLLDAMPPGEVVLCEPVYNIGVGVAGESPAGGHTIGTSFELGGVDFLAEAVAEFVAFFEERWGCRPSRSANSHRDAVPLPAVPNDRIHLSKRHAMSSLGGVGVPGFPLVQMVI